jgi:hypothetical protein
MRMKLLPIPETEQLAALTSGLPAVYRLLSEYLGDLNNVPNFRRHITVTKGKLADYLRQHPGLAMQHVSSPDAPKFHEAQVLERSNGGYRVYTVDHGKPWDVAEFQQLADAAAEYLMRGLGLG